MQTHGGEGDSFRPRQRKWNREPRIADRHAAHQRKRHDREPTRHKRYANFSRTIRTEPPKKKIQSDDPDFSAKVRIIYKLIKTVHHLKNVSDDIPPPSLNRITNNLMTVIKPAIPNREVQTLIEGNAKNWARATIMTLRNHYNECMEEIVKALFEFPEQHWGGPFEIAASWAKRNLGRRLQPESLEQAEAFIVAKLADVQATTGSTASHHQLQVHAPPTPNTAPKITAVTTSDPLGGDQPLFRGTEEVRDGDLRPATPPVYLQEPEPNQVAPGDQMVRKIPTARHGASSGWTSSPVIQLQHGMEAMGLIQGESTPSKTNRTSVGQEVCTPTIHPRPQKWPSEWRLHTRETSVILGDRNVGLIPPHLAEGVQIESFPGAKWHHAGALLERAEVDTAVEKLILSFGLHNRHQRDKNQKDQPITELKEALRTARAKFPQADICVPVINFSSAFPKTQQDRLLHINNFITGLKGHIPALPADKFDTQDNFHWTDKTAEYMFDHWNCHISS